MTRTGRTVACLVAGMSMTAASLAQDGGETVFAMEWVSLDDMVVDSRDEGMRRAISMIPARVTELPLEIDDMPKEASALINMVLATVSRPARFAMQYHPNNQSGGAFGYGLVISSLAGDRGEADKLHATIHGLLHQSDAPFEINDSERFATMSEFQTPMGVVSFGPRQADDGWRYEILVGTLADPSSAFEDMPTAEFDVVASGKAQLEHLTPLAQFIMGMAGDNPQVQEIYGQVEEAGLIGEDAIGITYTSGYTPDAAVERFVIQDARQYADALGMETEPLTKRDYRVIPADAVVAGLVKADLDDLDKMIEQYKEMPQVAEFLDEFRERTGVDLQLDVIRTVGGTMGYYMADSTGGGGLMSTVLFTSLRDRERFLGAHEKLARFANRMIDEHGEEAAPYIDLASWSTGGTDLMSVRFNGIPVPFELTYAVKGDWLVFGATPQAVIAATRQVAGEGDAGLLANPRFAGAVSKPAEAISVGFIDTPHVVGDGYTMVSMLGSALANGVRSPHSGRDPGLVVPVYADLAKDARAVVQYSYWSGDDYITNVTADRCMLVNACALGGTVMKFAPAIAAGIGLGVAAEENNWLSSIEPPISAPFVWRAITGDPMARAVMATVVARETQTDATPVSVP